MAIYQDGGVKGRPSTRSFGVWYFLYHTILEGKKIEFYMIYQENFKKEIKGLFGERIIKNAYISYKLIEQCCIEDYLDFENNQFPEWNVQEQGLDWPLSIKNKHTEILKSSSEREEKNHKKRGKKIR